ncbi:MAG: OsmC family protein [Nitrospiraceae bacterium]|jgi:putative redox protein|nr:MAG: OsmC family protein [Nitrospiraceae bacterium]
MPKATIKYTGGMQFVAVANSGHAVVMDGPLSVGGNNSGVSPMELLLMGTGGCSGMDVISVLQKKKQHVTSLEIHVVGEKADEHPKKYTAITIEFVITGKNISEEAVKRSVQLSMDKYCSVKATLEGTAQITYSYKIIEA